MPYFQLNFGPQLSGNPYKMEVISVIRKRDRPQDLSENMINLINEWACKHNPKLNLQDLLS